MIHLLARLEDVPTDEKFDLDGSSVSKFISRRNVHVFLTKFPHERAGFYIFARFPGMPIVVSYLICTPCLSILSEINKRKGVE